MNLFENFGLSHEVLSTIGRMGFEKPTPIQDKTIPHIVKGKDIVGESATGSGKTLAFGCGIVEKVVPRQGLQALVVTPTRELAEQVKDALKELSGDKKLRVISVYGGVAIGPQIHAVSNGAEVVVATPGRLLDHMRQGTINLSKIRVLVLDEADRMFDMGFIEDVETIIKECPRQRQTMFFSATILPRIQQLAGGYMNDPVNVSVDNQVDPSKLKQTYYDVPKNAKLSLLVHLLQEERSGLVMVFCNTRRTTDFVVKNLTANKIDAIAIHGGLSQNKRGRTIKSFNDGKVSVLVCTDVAARGLDIDDVSHVYNYEVPKDATDYVHRIGRTARAGKDGCAINLICELDHDNFSRVLQTHRTFKIDEVQTPEFKRIFAIKDFGRGRDNFRGNGFRNGRRPSHGRRRR